MEINSQQVCAKCESLERCVTTAVFNTEAQIRCIHFGYVKKVADNYMDKFKDEIIKIKNELIGYEG